MTLGSLPFLDKLAPCKRVLLAGAGGGFDILTGVPLYFHLKAQGKEVFLASLSFSELKKANGNWLNDRILEVTAQAGGEDHYFPERYLSEWFLQNGHTVPIYCFRTAGATLIQQIYQKLVDHLDIDAIVLVDGGTDSLMRGDEPGLGSPAEDMSSIAAVHRLESVQTRLLLNLGFGVDTHHGVCHAHVLEAVADLTPTGDFLGAWSLLPGMPEFQKFCEAVRYVCGKMPGHESIVTTSIVAAGEGRFGDHHATERTHGTPQFINPLMSMYWGFNLDGVAKRCLYLDYLLETYDRWDVHRAISNYLHTVTPREWQTIPL